MAGQSKDDLAKALEAMSAGEAKPEQPRPQPHPQPQQPTESRPASPMRAAPAAASVKKAPSKTAAGVAAIQGLQSQIRFKQTIIPPLLTMGGLFVLMALVSLVEGEDSLIGDQTVLKICMLVMGFLLVGAAGFTMLQVKQVLSQTPGVDTP